jgi:DNA-directed RNA polymerase subunit RPC12/RpoP
LPVFDACPHCGRDLSPWEKVLLGVDRALMCKHCWYRIILDPPPEEPAQPQNSSLKENP